MEEPSEIGPWKFISVLGSGAFGVVSLWRDEITGDSIAIKKCKFQTVAMITEKQRERWRNEVFVMKTINCPNIVSYKSLPKELEIISTKFNPSGLPLLAMEYCRRGNLRHVLNQPKHFCGLPEKTVRTILGDVTTAVSYLHSLKITHRDIKPENIVLQECASRQEGVLYKIIDLGYAKELSDTVISFVGTLHYLAPEIFKTENYNQSVDYWSLGVLAFEVICGVLPFLPHFSPVERFPYIENKKPEHICIYQLHSGSVSYSSEILKENHISPTLKENIEFWLRHLLQYDPLKRSQNLPTGTNIFDSLLKILEKKIVTVFSVNTLEFYSYEINDSTQIGTVKEWIARDTKVQNKDQVLLTNKLTDFSDSNCVVDINNEILFVFKKGSFISRENFNLPKYVKVLFDFSTKYTWKELRPIYGKNLYFLVRENKLISTLILAFKLYFNQTIRTVSSLRDRCSEIQKQFSKVLLKIESFCEIRRNFSDVDSEIELSLSKFQRLLASLERAMQQLKKLNRNIAVMEGRRKALESFFPKITGIMESCNIAKHVADATDLLLKMQTCNKVCDSHDMLKVVNNHLKEKNKLLNQDKMFSLFAKATSVSYKDAESLTDWMETFQNYILQLSKAVDDNQRELYILLSSKKVHGKVLVNGFVSEARNIEAVIKENEDLQSKFNDSLANAFLSCKINCDEINKCLDKF